MCVPLFIWFRIYLNWYKNMSVIILHFPCACPVLCTFHEHSILKDIVQRSMLGAHVRTSTTSQINEPNFIENISYLFGLNICLTSPQRTHAAAAAFLRASPLHSEIFHGLVAPTFPYCGQSIHRLKVFPSFHKSWKTKQKNDFKKYLLASYGWMRVVRKSVYVSCQ